MWFSHQVEEHTLLVLAGASVMNLALRSASGHLGYVLTSFKCCWYHSIRRCIQYRLLSIWQCKNPSQRHAVVGKTVGSCHLFQPKPQKKTEALVFGSHECTCLAVVFSFMCSSLLFNRCDFIDLMSHRDLRGAWLQLELELNRKKNFYNKNWTRWEKEWKLLPRHDNSCNCQLWRLDILIAAAGADCCRKLWDSWCISPWQFSPT